MRSFIVILFFLLFFLLTLKSVKLKHLSIGTLGDAFIGFRRFTIYLFISNSKFVLFYRMNECEKTEKTSSIRSRTLVVYSKKSFFR